MKVILFLLCFFASEVHTQDILGLSAFQSCYEVSVGDISLNCTNSQGLATILDLSVSPSESSAENVFVLNITTLPPDSLSTQVKTTSKCQIATTDGRCQTSTPTKVTITASKPLIRYQLRRTNGRTKSPFSVPFAYYLLQTVTNWNELNNQAFCELYRTYSKIVDAEPPSAGQIFSDFKDTVQNDDKIRCDPTLIPTETIPKTVSAMSTNMMVNSFSCAQDKSDVSKNGYATGVTTQFLELGPQCFVYEIENPPAVSAEITITLENENGIQEIYLESASLGTSGTSSDGSVLARIERVQSPSGKEGQNLPGIIVQCTELDKQGDQVIFMTPYPFPKSENPFNYREDNDPLYDKSFRMPTPADIGDLLEQPLNNTMWYYVDNHFAQGYGENCGAQGVATTIYQHPPQGLFFEHYTQQIVSTADNSNNDPGTFYVAYGDLGESKNILTCVPGFGFPYLGLETPTPCSTLANFLSVQQQMVSSNTPTFGIENMPPMYNPLKPNMWVNGTELFYEAPPRDITFEIVLNFAGSFLGVAGKVPLGDINNAGSACIVSTDATQCQTTTININNTACGIYLQVCNPSGSGFVGNYIAQAVCDASSNISPLVPDINVFDVQPGKCKNTVIPLSIVSVPLPDSPTCQVTLFSNDGSISPKTVTLWEQSFVCQETNTTFAQPGNLPLLNTTLAELAGNPAPPPPTSTFWATFISILIFVSIAVCMLSLILGLIYYCVYQSRAKKIG